MNRPRFFIHLLIITMLGLFITSTSSFALDQQEPAVSGATDTVAAEPSEEYLKEMLFHAWTGGDYPRMADILSQLVIQYPESPYVPAYLSLWGGSEFHGWDPRDRVKVLRKALQNTSSIPHRQQLAYELTETLDMLLDESVEQAARTAGLLLDHWNVIGPFGRYGAADLFEAFGPETGFRTTYDGWKDSVEFSPLKNLDKTGLVELEAFIHPDTGIAYALNVIESETDSDGWLTVYSPAAFQVWWNGKPIAEKAHYFLHTAKSNTVPVKMKSGKNLLVIKSQKTSSSWWLRASLQAKENNQHEFRSIPFDITDFSSTYLLPFNAAFERTEDTAIEISPYPFSLPGVADVREDIYKNTLTAVWHLDRGEYEAARQDLLNAQQSLPEFALAYALYGEASLRLAENRGGSKARFQQEAETAFQKALELDPACITALLGLVTYFLDRDQTDQALEFLNQHLENNPGIRENGHSNLIDYSYGILYSKKHFDTDAILQYKKSMDGWIPSFEIFRMLFDYHYRAADRKEAARISAETLCLFPAYLPLLERASRLDGNADIQQQVRDCLQRAVTIHPDRLQYLLLYGEILENSGKLDDALDWYKQLLERYPQHPRILERKAALDYLNGDEEKALAAYKQIYDIEPQHMRPFRALRDAGSVEDFPYQQYDVQLDDIDISDADRWKTSRASGIYLLDIMVLDIHEDGTYDQYTHQAIKVMNQEGMRKWAETVIPKGGQVEILMARTITPDGTEWDVTNVQDLSGQQSLSMYGIEPGVILEFAYLERIGRNSPGVNFTGGGYFFGSDDDPMLLSKITIVKPENTPFHLDQNPNDFGPQITREDGKIIYAWEKKLSKGLKPERFAPPLGQRVPSIHWSTCPDWLPFVERERMSVWGYEEASPLIDDLAKKFLAGSKTKRDYVEKVYDFVQSQIEETSGGFTTTDTLTLGAGGKYQKMRLARHLLRKADIEAKLALTIDNEPKNGYRPLPTLSYSGSMVLAVPCQDGISERILLDFSSRFASMGSIDPGVRKQVALIYDAKTPYFEPLDPALWEHGLIGRNFRMTVQKDNSARIEGEYTYGNIYDRQIREALTNPEVKQRLADSQLAGELRGIQIAQSEIQDLDTITKPPRLVFSGTIPDIVKPAGVRSLRISPVQVRTNASSFIGEPTREFRIEFKSSPMWDPLIIRMDLSHYLDREATFSIPQNVFLLTEFGFYSLFYEWDGSELIIRRSFLIPKQNIEPEDYQKFVEFCRTIDQSEDRDIIISLPPQL